MISIVDDDPSVRDATDAFVSSLGYQTITFASAEEFLRSERVNDSSCLITDLQMPGLNGAGLQGELLARGSCVPIIFISGSLEESIHRRVMQAGAIGFLSKPFHARQLMELLETVHRRDMAA